MKQAVGVLMGFALVRSVTARVLPKTQSVYDQAVGDATTQDERRFALQMKGYRIVGKLSEAGKLDKLFALAQAEGIKL